MDALKDIEHLTGDEPVFSFDELNASGVRFTLRLRPDTAGQSEYLRAGSDVYAAPGIRLA